MLLVLLLPLGSFICWETRGWAQKGIIMFLQSLPTQGWTDHEIELLLSEAFVHYSTWHNAQSHFGK